MAKAKIDVRGLHSALDAQRDAKSMSWRQLAKEIGVSPSLLARLGNGYRPDADGFATLVSWLNMPAEQFMTVEGAETDRPEPELAAQLAPLLRARKDLNEADVAYLEDVIRATVRRAKAERD
ncbi:MAG TPA: helix-turn-helix domain-containing protein [Candidatus Acidoferrum sp.]|jgi:transcriptional regulator with XRE-family HTH domain|nr:helix-turn-helix domain-containing protein [Candidatus Acidoferrum sp.]